MTRLRQLLTVIALLFAAGLVSIGSASAAPVEPTFTITPNPVADGATAVFKGTGCVARAGDPDGFVPTVYLGVIAPDVTDSPMTAAVIGAAEDNDDDAPVLTPDAAGNWSYDLEIPQGLPDLEITFTAVCDGYNWSYDYRPVTLTIDGEPIQPILLLPDFADLWESGGTPTLVVGRSYQILSGLFTPGEKVALTLHSVPLAVATFTADADGVVDSTFTLPAGATAGAHELVMTGVDSGVSASAAVTVSVPAGPITTTATATVIATVTATPTANSTPVSVTSTIAPTTTTTVASDPQLAATGIPAGSMSLFGVLLLALGGAGLFLGRRRSQRQH